MKKFVRFYFICLLLVSRVSAQTLAVTPQTACFNGSANLVYVSISGTVPTANSYSWSVMGGCAGSLTVFNGTVVNFPATCCGVYTVTCSAWNTTVSTSPVLISSSSVSSTIACAPSVTVTGSSTGCAGQSRTLTASGASGYTWMPGNLTGQSVIVSPVANTCYTVTGSNGGSCNGTAVKCLTVYPVPTITIGGQQTGCTGVNHTLYAIGAASYTWQPYNLTNSLIVVTPTANSCYTVTGITSVGCTGTASSCFSLSSAPNLSISGNSSVVCPGTPISYFGSGASSYTWTPGNVQSASITVTPYSNSCYTLTGSNSNCTASAVMCASVFSTPTISVSGPTTTCANSTISLSASGATNFTWMPGNFTGTTISVSPTISTCYTVSANTGTSCASMSVHCVNISAPTLSVGGGSSFCAGANHTFYAVGASTYTWLPFNITGSLIVVTPTANGCYTVNGLSTTGCTSSATGCYTLGNTPTISVSGASIVCPGTNQVLTASGAATYTWVPNTNIHTSTLSISPFSNTCYTVLGNNGSCGTGSAVICATVFSTPTIAVSGPTAGCSGNSMTLTASGAQNYTWQPGNLTATTIVVSPSSNTCYTVSASNGTSCPSATNICINIAPTPTISIGGGTTSLCSGNNHTFTASGASSFTWLPYNITGPTAVVNTTVSGCYTVIAMTSAGCTNSASNCYSISPSPSITITGPTTLCAGSTLSLSASGASSYTWFPGNATGQNYTATPTATSSCFYVYGYANGCYTTTSKCVTLSPAPNMSVSGAATICPGGSTTLSASGAASYSWNSGATSSTMAVTPGASTCYTVTGSGTNGCTTKSTVCVAVQNPSITIAASSASVCRGSSVTFTASGAVTYTWTTGSSTNILNATPNNSTTYTVLGTSSAGCFGFASIAVLVDTTCSYVWPGDANGDGIVSAVDAFELGLAYNNTGSARTPTSNTYLSWYATNWTGTVSTAKNKCHADCNGDGVINLNDTVAIVNNFSLTHPLRPGAPATSGDVWLTAANNQAYAGLWNKADVMLGTNNLPMNQIYGVAFDLDIDQTYLDANNAYLIYTPSFMNANGVNVEFQKNLMSSGKIYAATVRTDFANVDGSGKIGELWFKVREDAPVGSFVNVAVLNPARTNKDGLGGMITAANGAFEILGKPDGITETNVILNSIAVFPNPAREQVIFQAPYNNMYYTISDVLGREITKGSFDQKKTLDLGNFSKGSYIISFESDGVTCHRKFIIE